MDNNRYDTVMSLHYASTVRSSSLSRYKTGCLSRASFLQECIDKISEDTQILYLAEHDEYGHLLEPWASFSALPPDQQADLIADARKLRNRANDLINLKRQASLLARRLDTISTPSHPAVQAAGSWLRKAPLVRDLRSEFGLDLPANVGDKWTRQLAMARNRMRKTDYEQRLSMELFQYARDWYVVFDTLTIDPLMETEFLKHPRALGYYMQTIGRGVNKALGRRVSTPFSDVFRFFIVPELGRKDGRLHFHCLYLFKALPFGAIDPNIGRKKANYREIKALKKWPYGFSAPIAVRFSGDKFTQMGWYWPVDKDGYAIECKPVIAVVFYMTKYVGKNLEEDKAKWKNKEYRIRMTKRFGETQMTNLSPKSLLEIMAVDRTMIKFPMILARSAKRELLSRLDENDFRDMECLPRTNPLLQHLRTLTQKLTTHKPLNSIDTVIPRLTYTDISAETLAYVQSFDAKMCQIGVSGK